MGKSYFLNHPWMQEQALWMEGREMWVQVPAASSVPALIVWVALGKPHGIFEARV